MLKTSPNYSSVYPPTSEEQRLDARRLLGISGQYDIQTHTRGVLAQISFCERQLILDPSQFDTKRTYAATHRK